MLKIWRRGSTSNAGSLLCDVINYDVIIITKESNFWLVSLSLKTPKSRNSWLLRATSNQCCTKNGNLVILDENSIGKYSKTSFPGKRIAVNGTWSLSGLIHVIDINGGMILNVCCTRILSNAVVGQRRFYSTTEYVRNVYIPVWRICRTMYKRTTCFPCAFLCELLITTSAKGICWTYEWDLFDIIKLIKCN